MSPPFPHCPERSERRVAARTKKGGGDRSTPPFPRGAYFFFFVAFLAAFFFAGIRQIPPFGPWMDRSRPSVNISRDKERGILGVG